MNCIICLISGSTTQFLVVDSKCVLGSFSDIEKAKESLAQIKQGIRLIAEVDEHGKLNRDPHIVGGQNQNQAAGFNKYWRDWPDINKIMDICEKYLVAQGE